MRSEITPENSVEVAKTEWPWVNQSRTSKLLHSLVARVETLETESRHYQHEAESWRQAWSDKQDEYRQCLDDGLVLAKATEDQHENYMRLDAIARQLCSQIDAAVAILREAALFSTASILHERIEDALFALTANDAKVTT